MAAYSMDLRLRVLRDADAGFRPSAATTFDIAATRSLRPHEIRFSVDGVMTAHIEVPGLDPAEATPVTFSARVVRDVLHEELGFDGLVFTDSLRMRAVTALVSPGEAAALAVHAGHDVVLYSPDDAAAFAGKDAVSTGMVAEADIDESVERLLTAKARLGLHRSRAVDLETLPLVVGTRKSLAVAEEISQRSLTLLKDDERDVPLRVARSAEVLYLSVVDHPSGWGITAPSATFIPELEQRWPNVTAVELSDRTPVSEIELVGETASRFDAVIVGLFVRAASLNGRMDLSGELVGMLQRVARRAGQTGQPFVTVVFGNPYVATLFEDFPSMLLTYDVADLSQASAVRALAGERPIAGRLPITLGARFPVGHGLVREVP